MANIFWAYDQSEGSFSPLPASPWLLPVIGVYAFAGLVQAIKDKQPQPELEPLPKIDPVLYENNKKRYYYLLQRQVDGKMTEEERFEMYRLVHPPWVENGKVWAY
jgi:hypothetical protein